MPDFSDLQWQDCERSLKPFFFFCSETNTVCENIHPGAKYMYRKVKAMMKRLGRGPWSLLFGKGFHTFIHIPVYPFVSSILLSKRPSFLNSISSPFNFIFFSNPSNSFSIIWQPKRIWRSIFVRVQCLVLRHVIFVDWELSVSSKGYLTLRENRKCYYG